MRLIRLRVATAILRGAGFVAGVIAGPGLTSETSRRREVLPYHPAGHILLASLVGLAICFFWIWINGRAWQ